MEALIEFRDELPPIMDNQIDNKMKTAWTLGPSSESSGFLNHHSTHLLLVACRVGLPCRIGLRVLCFSGKEPTQTLLRSSVLGSILKHLTKNQNRSKKQTT